MPETSSYTLRAIDKATMKKARQRSIAEEVPIKDVLLWALDAYAKGKQLTYFPVPKP